MRRKVVSVALALCMLLALMPTVALAEENAPPPTNLRWDENGGIWFNVPDVEKCDMWNSKLYCDGEEIFDLNWTSDFRGYHSNSPGENGSVYYDLKDKIDKGGEYIFKICLRYPSGNTSGATSYYSEWVASEPLRYTHPGISLQPPANFTIDENYNVIWMANKANQNYRRSTRIILYFLEPLDGKWRRTAWTRQPMDEEYDPAAVYSMDFVQKVLRNSYVDGGYSGPYGITFTTISEDIQLIGHSEESEMIIFNYNGDSSSSKIALTKSMFTVDTTPETYDGTAKIKPISSTLTEGSDYAVSYANNVNAGTATITITGKGNYSGAVTYTFEIVEEETLLFSVIRKSVTLIDGNSAVPRFSVSPEAAEVTWDSSDSAVVRVTQDGGITGVGEGSAVITGTARYKGRVKTLSYTVIVKPRIGVKLMCSEVVTPLPNPAYKLHFSYSPLDAKITVTSSNPNVAQVEYPAGTSKTAAYIRPKGGGTAIVTVTVEKDGKSKSASCTVTVPSANDNLAQKYVDYAHSFAGKPKTTVSKMLNNPLTSNAWCANFVSQAAKDVGLGEIIPLNYGCSALCNSILAQNGMEVSIPQPGDIVFFKWNKDCKLCSTENRNAANGDRFNHVGIVKEVNGTAITIIHGNYNTYHKKASDTIKYDFEGEKQVTENTWNAGPNGHKCIVKYVRPNWATLPQPKSGKVTIKFRCPIDVRYTYGDEVLDSATGQLETSFGTMVVNEAEESITVTLNDYYHVDAEITGTGEGAMDLTATFEDEDGTTSTRSFQSVPISPDTLGKLYAADSVANAYLELYKNEGEDFVEVWTAGQNETAIKRDDELTAWYTEGNDFEDAKDKLTLSDDDLSLYIGKTSRVTASITGYAGMRVYAVSSDASIATATVQGTDIAVTGVAEGTTSVYVVASDTAPNGPDAAKADPSAQEIRVTVARVGGGGPSSGGSPGGSSSSGGSRPAATPKPTASPRPTATPTPQPAKPASELFADVAAGSWYESGITFVVDRGLFNGMAPGKFGPEFNMTRAMLMTVLARLDGQNTAGGDPWYAKSVDWARNMGISDGTMPESNVTREQLVTMLYRYTKATPGNGTLLGFIDGDTVSPWAMGAMTWAVDEGIIIGTDWGGLCPQGTASRAEVAVMLMRMVELMVQ